MPELLGVGDHHLRQRRPALLQLALDLELDLAQARQGRLQVLAGRCRAAARRAHELARHVQLPSLVSAMTRTQVYSSSRMRVSMSARPDSGVSSKLAAIGVGLRSTTSHILRM
jgi:hypothetical protein